MRLCVLLLLLPVGVYADSLLMKNGDRLSGKVIAMEDDKLRFHTDYAGDLLIAKEQIEQLETEQKIDIVLTATPDANQPGELRQDKHSKPEPLSAISEITPEPEFHPALAWTGDLDADLNFKREQSSTNDIRLKSTNELSWGYWRDSVKLALDRTRSDGETSTFNYELGQSLDYFWNANWFWRGQASYQRDYISNPYQQSQFGSGPGFRFYDNQLGRFELIGTVGEQNYFYRDYRDYRFAVIGGGWDYRQQLIGTRLEFYTNGELLYPFLEEAHYAVKGEAGFRLRLTDSLRFTASSEFNSLDAGGDLSSYHYWKHFFGIGYSW